jgi:hypothetical protein
MEGAFTADFSAVRVHAGPASERVASGLGARALTAGRDIVFGPGMFRPYTPAGDRLLAHELAHVVQQAGGLPRAAIDRGAADPLEQAAETAADQAVTSGRVAGLAPVSPGRGESLAYALSHVVQRGSGVSAIQRAPDNEDDYAPVVKGPPPIGSPLLPYDPNMCGGRRCLTDKDIDPANLSRIPMSQAELNAEAARLGEKQGKRRRFWDSMEKYPTAIIENFLLPQEYFRKSMTDLDTYWDGEGFRRFPEIDREESEVLDNDEARLIYDEAWNRAVYQPEEESAFHKAMSWICRYTNPCHDNMEEYHKDLESGMSVQDAQARGLVRIGLFFLPLGQPNDIPIKEEPATPLVPTGEPAQIGPGDVGRDPGVTEVEPEPPMQTSRPKDTSKTSRTKEAKPVIRQPEPREPYKFKPGIDEDWRGESGTERTWRDALASAFEKTGVDRSEFTETKWGRTKDGKSFPVEYRVLDGPNRGAEVNIDPGHKIDGPEVPHVGWQKPGKGAGRRGHILLDDVPMNRSGKKLKAGEKSDE